MSPFQEKITYRKVRGWRHYSRTFQSWAGWQNMRFCLNILFAEFGSNTAFKIWKAVTSKTRAQIVQCLGCAPRNCALRVWIQNLQSCMQKSVWRGVLSLQWRVACSQKGLCFFIDWICDGTTLYFFCNFMTSQKAAKYIFSHGIHVIFKLPQISCVPSCYDIEKSC